MTRLTLLFIFILSNIIGVAQDNVARLTVLIGSHIEFNFNTLDNYNNGIRIEDGTTIGITMSEISPAILTGWHIDVQTFMGEVTIEDLNKFIIPIS